MWRIINVIIIIVVAAVTAVSRAMVAAAAAAASSSSETSAVFQLYEDFDLSASVKGGESWAEMLMYRNQAEHPSLSFYVDKVARKRWLHEQGHSYNISQPKPYALLYADELVDASKYYQTMSGYSDEEQQQQQEAQAQEALFLAEVKAIRALLPDDKPYAAKPTHMSHSMGNWLVDPVVTVVSVGEEVGDGDGGGITKFSLGATELSIDSEDGQAFDKDECAYNLAGSLHEPCADFESHALKRVYPGVVIEERWSALHNPDVPPDEFCIFTIWGTVWGATWNTVSGQSRYYDAFVYRNRTLAEASLPISLVGNDADGGGDNDGGDVDEDDNDDAELLQEQLLLLPDWIPWERMVEIAEELGAHKDMFRTDIFVGRPTAITTQDPEYGCSSEIGEENNNNGNGDDNDSGDEDGKNGYNDNGFIRGVIEPQIVVSESEIFPTTVFDAHPYLPEEAAKLWVNGYLSGHYVTVPNTEVPSEFVQTEKLSNQCPILLENDEDEQIELQ